MQEGCGTRAGEWDAPPSTRRRVAQCRFSTRSLCAADGSKQSTRQQPLQASTRHSSVGCERTRDHDAQDLRR